MAGGIAHDFNNLLTVILGSSELLSAQLPEERLVSSITLAAERGAELVKELLRCAGREPMQLRPMCVNDSVRETVSLLERTARPIDVLVTDLVMPGMSGRELAERVRERRPGLPVVYVSGYSEEILASRGALEPGTILVRKPFTNLEIDSGLRRALALTANVEQLPKVG